MGPADEAVSVYVPGDEESPGRTAALGEIKH
jgi:hypothetical protein